MVERPWPTPSALSPRSVQEVTLLCKEARMVTLYEPGWLDVPRMVAWLKEHDALAVVLRGNLVCLPKIGDSSPQRMTTHPV